MSLPALSGAVEVSGAAEVDLGSEPVADVELGPEVLDRAVVDTAVVDTAVVDTAVCDTPLETELVDAPVEL